MQDLDIRPIINRLHFLIDIIDNIHALKIPQPVKIGLG